MDTEYDILWWNWYANHILWPVNKEETNLSTKPFSMHFFVFFPQNITRDFEKSIKKIYSPNVYV